MRTYEECCSEVAKKYGLGSKLVTGHRDKYWTEAAQLFAKEALISASNCVAIDYESDQILALIKDLK